MIHDGSTVAVNKEGDGSKRTVKFLPILPVHKSPVLTKQHYQEALADALELMLRETDKALVEHKRNMVAQLRCDQPPTPGDHDERKRLAARLQTLTDLRRQATHRAATRQ